MAVISYMGTKAALAGQIAKTFERLSPGPLLDLFAGMATIGKAVAPARNVWLNDVQHFSRITCELQFLNCNGSHLRREAYRVARAAYLKHYRDLISGLDDDLAREDIAIRTSDWRALSLAEYIGQAGIGGVDPNRKVSLENYQLFTSIYRGTYFGLRQCIQIDAIRKGIDIAAPENDEKFSGVRRWMLAALGAAASRCSNSTGHFAQYLTVSPSNVHRIVSQRRRNIYEQWLIGLRSTSQIGNYAWRAGNKTFNADACKLLEDLEAGKSYPSVIYADPPYTSDQYSRYYHILETLVLYDYPDVSGKGLYRSDRFVSSWSLKTKVEESFFSLIRNAAALRSSLVISYPTNGLLLDSGKVIPQMLREYYKSVNCLTPLIHQHSTMGGSKGSQRTEVMEQIFVAC